MQTNKAAARRVKDFFICFVLFVPKIREFFKRYPVKFFIPTPYFPQHAQESNPTFPINVMLISQVWFTGG